MTSPHLQAPETIHLSDYKSPAYLVESVDLLFQLTASATRVSSQIHLYRNPDRTSGEPLFLAGEQLKLMSLKLDGILLDPSCYQVSDEGLTVAEVPHSFLLEVETEIDPASNTALEGLYLSSGNFCTQCEAQGFRNITYYPDRPDVMAKFRVRIEADRNDYPVLLSNGNLIESGDLAAGQHFVQWEDPFPKPSYLFALVAGDLTCIEDRFTTRSGREILLQIYVEHRNRDLCDHAMLSLKKSMEWDEKVYGLEYDLDRYMIVAVDDFNMGAMENKGLNVFNSKYVLALPEVATDNDFLGVEAVIGHEYFHNYTGNRVTCRDWFQLSLKEGLTVFRDQEFSADLNSAAVKRIDDVRILRQSQFPEDAGPMAHPVRPASYVEINNFYTVTVYNKGAELIRMQQALLGKEAFNMGVRHYLRKHDGQAVTTDDFVAALEECSGQDLTLFRRWYAQAGTPRLSIETSYDAVKKEYRLLCRQSCPATPDQTAKKPFQIPFAIGMLDADGTDMPLNLVEGKAAGMTTLVLDLQQAEQEFVFENVETEPILSPLRGFSAPVILEFPQPDAELAFRMTHDSDSFNRWEAAQQLAQRELLAALENPDSQVLSELFVNSWNQALADQKADAGLLTQLLTLPSEVYLGEQMSAIDPGRIHLVRQAARRQLATASRGVLIERLRAGRQTQSYSLDPLQVGNRSLKNFCLSLLMVLEDAEVVEYCLQQYEFATNMTDRLAALTCLASSSVPQRQKILEAFYLRWEKQPLVVDKWFMLQAMADRQTICEDVAILLKHPAFNMDNPNRVRSLISAFAAGNPDGFHQVDGTGYRFLTEQILYLNQRNPQLAARLALPLSRWKRFETTRSVLMREQLEELQQQELSRDLFEIVSKSLK